MLVKTKSQGLISASFPSCCILCLVSMEILIGRWFLLTEATGRFFNVHYSVIYGAHTKLAGMMVWVVQWWLVAGLADLSPVWAPECSKSRRHRCAGHKSWTSEVFVGSKDATFLFLLETVFENSRAPSNLGNGIRHPGISFQFVMSHTWTQVTIWLPAPGFLQWTGSRHWVWKHGGLDSSILSSH